MAKKKAAKKQGTKKKTAKKKSTKRKTTRKLPAGTKAKPAAKVNKSASIREFATKNPDLGPTAISKALGEQGIAASPSFVSVVLTKSKSTSKKSAKTRGVGRPRKAPSALKNNGTVSIDQLKAAKRFANSVGGIAKAKATINALAAVMEA